MKIRRVKRTAVTLGLLLLIIAVGFALGMAQDSGPAEAGYSAGLRHSAAETAACAGDCILRFGLPAKSGDSSIALGRNRHEAAISYSPLGGPNLSPTSAKPRKIALHLLDSVLLI